MVRGLRRGPEVWTVQHQTKHVVSEVCQDHESQKMKSFASSPALDFVLLVASAGWI